MTYNEFVGKKLGEVLAFARVEIDTYEKGKDALVRALGEERVAGTLEQNALHSESILKLATDAGVVDTTLAKADKTEAKLKQMRDLYVGDQWDNATELLEWGGFFEGAAVVHFALVRGAGEGMNDENLIGLAQEGIDAHRALLETAESELATIGQDKSTMA